MDILTQVQSLVTDHAVTIGLCLLVAVVLAGVAWFSMSRLGSSSKSNVLVNQARVNQAEMPPGEQPVQNQGQEHVEEANDLQAQPQASTDE